MATTPLREILRSGLEMGASDWHVREGSPVAYRVAGQMVSDGTVATPDFVGGVVLSLMGPAQQEAYSRDGDLDFAVVEDDLGRFRVNVHRQRGLTSMTLRHVKAEVPNVDQLGLPPMLLHIAEAKDGIVFVTGATGSGKSTTLACMIDHINATKPIHIITIEDPIEYNFTDRQAVVEQREVGLDTVSFDSALKHALRQDPDVIVVGELRSRDSFESALTAAETGHLVMTTLHTNNAAQSIDRILDFYPFAERDSVRKNLAGNLRAIMCQKLVPRADGKGVLPISEILINTPIVSKLILEDSAHKLGAAIEGGNGEGMVSFNQSLFHLASSGAITKEIALSFAPNPEGLEMNFSGIFLSESGGIIS